MRVVRGIEVTDETLSYDVIKDVVFGEGHYLGHAQTHKLMKSEFLYPEISDRRNLGDWNELGDLQTSFYILFTQGIVRAA